MIFDSPVYNSSEFFITAILIGSVVAVYYKRLTGVTPGGIVPIGASLILLIRIPLWAIFCFALSFVGFAAYLLVVSRLDKRGGFPHVYSISIITLLLGLGVAYSLQLLGLLDVHGMTIGGLVVPAILANQYRLYGIKRVVSGYLVCIIGSFLLVVCIVYIANSFGASEGLFAHFQTQHIPKETRYLEFFPLAAIVSLLFGFIVYRKLGLRSGGYIMAPLAAQLISSYNSFLILSSGLIVLYFMQLFLTRFTFIIGLQRYLANIALSSVYVWLSILFVQRVLSSQDANHFGSAWIMVLVLAAYSTDLYVYRSKKSYVYIALNTAIAFALIRLLHVAVAI